MFGRRGKELEDLHNQGPPDVEDQEDQSQQIDVTGGEDTGKVGKKQGNGCRRYFIETVAVLGAAGGLSYAAYRLSVGGNKVKPGESEENKPEFQFEHLKTQPVYIQVISPDGFINVLNGNLTEESQSGISNLHKNLTDLIIAGILQPDYKLSTNKALLDLENVQYQEKYKFGEKHTLTSYSFPDPNDPNKKIEGYMVQMSGKTWKNEERSPALFLHTNEGDLLIPQTVLDTNRVLISVSPELKRGTILEEIIQKQHAIVDGSIYAQDFTQNFEIWPDGHSETLNNWGGSTFIKDLTDQNSGRFINSGEISKALSAYKSDKKSLDKPNSFAAATVNIWYFAMFENTGILGKIADGLGKNGEDVLFSLAHGYGNNVDGTVRNTNEPQAPLLKFYEKIPNALTFGVSDMPLVMKIKYLKNEGDRVKEIRDLIVADPLGDKVISFKHNDPGIFTARVEYVGLGEGKPVENLSLKDSGIDFSEKDARESSALIFTPRLFWRNGNFEWVVIIQEKDADEIAKSGNKIDLKKTRIYFFNDKFEKPEDIGYSELNNPDKPETMVADVTNLWEPGMKCLSLGASKPSEYFQKLLSSSLLLPEELNIAGLDFKGSAENAGYFATAVSDLGVVKVSINGDEEILDKGFVKGDIIPWNPRKDKTTGELTGIYLGRSLDYDYVVKIPDTNKIMLMTQGQTQNIKDLNADRDDVVLTRFSGQTGYTTPDEARNRLSEIKKAYIEQ